jgi:glycosyltransferase involved in cell wall biosynthesis
MLSVYRNCRPLKVLFVYSLLQSFVKQDWEILSRHFNTRKLRLETFLVPRKGRSPLEYWRLFKDILWADVVFSWWATLNAVFIVLLCKILHKKSIIVIGGYEVAYVPEINYGSLLKPVGRLEVKFILGNADKIIAVSQSSMKEITRFAKPKNLVLIHNAVDVDKFKPLGQKENMVITVGSISDSTIGKKGFDVFVKTAKLVSDAMFVLVGKYDNSIESLKEIASSNVVFTGFLPDEKLLEYYQKAKVYCQLSVQESFGVALAEAMSCGCIPVVSKAYSLPEVAGDSGFYVPCDPEKIANAIRIALISDNSKARKRVVKSFSLEKREQRLVDEIIEVMT